MLKEKTDDGIKKLWNIYSMEYYLAIKRDDIMPLGAKLMELEVVMLCEKRKEKATTIQLHSYVEYRKVNTRTCIKKKPTHL